MVPGPPWWRAGLVVPWAAVALLLVSACAPSKPPAPGVPTPPLVPLSQQGIASWYGPGFHGKKTTSGTVYDQYGMTAAHQTLPLGSSVRVTNLTNGKSVTLLINDRGPFAKGRIIDLSYAAAQAVDIIRPGTAPVLVEVLDTGGQQLTAIPDRLDYTLQVGAFSDLGKARELKARLESRYDRPVVIKPHEGYYRVRVGTFADAAEARAYGARLSREGLPVVIVEKWRGRVNDNCACRSPFLEDDHILDQKPRYTLNSCVCGKWRGSWNPPHTASCTTASTTSRPPPCTSNQRSYATEYATRATTPYRV